jgi:hypothetical protein
VERSSKHGPRIDDELARETKPLERSGLEAHAGHVEEWREAEPVVEEDGTFDLPDDPVAARRELSRHLDLSAFPGDREALVANARQNNAPDDLLQLLGALPADREYGTAYDAWGALAETGALARLGIEVDEPHLEFESRNELRQPPDSEEDA